jgi:hypothetical protein
MLRFLAVPLAVALLVVSGVFHGLRTDRWGTSAAVEAAAERCEHLPLIIGGWKCSTEPEVIDAKALELAEIAGYVARRYTHPTKGDVHLLLVCGRPGPISLHPPDICFRGAGFEMVKSQQKHSVEHSDEFWTATFRSKNDAGPPLRAFWAWSNGGSWQAPEYPRVTFARSDYLYKLYVTRNLDETLNTDSCLDFLNVLLPELRKTLSPTP